MSRVPFGCHSVWLGLVSILLFSVSAKADELMKWERIPLSIALKVGQERIIFADRNVRIGFPPSLSDKLRVQSAGGAIYLKANNAFPPTCLQLQDSENGEIILLDITAAKAGPTEPVRIIYSDEKKRSQKNNHSPRVNLNCRRPFRSF